ncbi:type VII secretion protein EssC [Sporolactobacillus sp. Y61]|uniref:Type VII secretion protein EssC n=1 Tax=Sporolactobacillus sp. Y61 TaxID=3160863 RepID=A0AAU8II06_9BACL
MEKIWLFTEAYVQCTELQPFHKKGMVIGNQPVDTLTVPALGDDKIRLVWNPENRQWTFRLKEKEEILSDGKSEAFPGGMFVYRKTADGNGPSGYYIGNARQISVSPESDADFSFPAATEQSGFQISREQAGWRVFPVHENTRVYVNGGRVRGSMLLQPGDIISWDLNEWTLKSDDLLVLSTGETFTTDLCLTRDPQTILSDKYPDYRRMPRLIYERPKDKVKFSWPSNNENDGRRNLWITILPPVVMLLVMGLVLIIQPSGIYMLLSIVMFVSTIITSSYQYFRDSRREKARRHERETNYTHYMTEKREELNSLYEKQRFVLRYQFPPTDRLKELTDQLSPRIWERSREDEDFLDIRLGLTDLAPDYEIQGSDQDLSNQSFDALYREAKRLIDHYRTIRDVPLTIRLLDGPVGIVGKHSIIRKAVQQMILQLAFFHSYHDLRLVVLFDEEEYEEWAWLKWLPHLRSLSTSGRNLIYNEQTRDLTLSGLYELLKIREHTDKKEKKVFLPHIVFIVASDQLIHEHEITEFLNNDCTDIGVSSLFLANTKDNLNEHINTVIRYVNEREGDVLILNKVAGGQSFRLDPFSKKGNERFARRLASLNHQSGFTNSIPESVTFLDMMHAEDVRDLQIRKRWEEHDPIQSLAVPIGLRSKTDVLELNLHEKAHGPHGLLAGTTGSGKSELLQSYILSLAVNFHPHDVAFLLIDFKGGGMAQLFDKLPHLLGTMTNINDEKNFSDRALAAVKSESRRRQLLFSKYNINHIDDYQLLFKQGKVREPMPHLFIISDEFAELKKEEPDFIRELVTTARIGRSLGIHLILATQKPAGVVDDQIRSNSRFKIALRVQDASDSNDILGNGDAAELKQVGRGYLQVGNNEIYELFQSAWSGAPYEKNIYTSEDDVYYVRDTGLYPISEAHARTKAQEKKKTELEVIVQTIADLYHDMGLRRLPSPWLAPLPLHIVRPAATKEDEREDRFLIGLADHPEKQRQTPVYLNLQKGKNMAVFGASGFGKTTTVASFLLEAARRYSADQVRFYIFDFGSGGLLPFSMMHHTGDYFRLDEKEKIQKFAKWLNQEIRRRKDTLRRTGVPNIALFNEQENEFMPYIKIIVDHFEALREEQADELEESFVRWAREGGSLGFQFILTASRTNSIRPNLLASLPVRLVHYMVDQSDFYSIFSGSAKRTVEPIPGRALIKREEVESVQIYLPFEAGSAGEQLDRLRTAVEECNHFHPTSDTIYHVPMLPEQLDVSLFLRNREMEPDTFYLGLDEETVEPLGVSRKQLDAFIIISDAGGGKTNAIRLFMEQLIRQGAEHVAVSDSDEMQLARVAEQQGWMYLDDGDVIERYLNQLEKALSVREQKVKRLMLESSLPRKEISDRYPAYYLLIDGLDTFIRNAGSQNQTRLVQLMKRFTSNGFHVIASGNQQEWKGYDPVVPELKNAKDALLLVKKSDQSVFTLPYVSREPALNVGFGYLIRQGQDRRVMIPLTDTMTLDTVNR